MLRAVTRGRKRADLQTPHVQEISVAQPARLRPVGIARNVQHRPAGGVAATAVIALARANGLLGAGRALTAQQVADELDVSLGALAVTEHELARALNLERYAHRLGAA